MVDGKLLHICSTQRTIGLKAALVYEMGPRHAVIRFHAHIHTDLAVSVFARVCLHKLVQSRVLVVSQHTTMRRSRVATVSAVFCNTDESMRRICEKTCDCVKKIDISLPCGECPQLHALLF